MCRYYTERVPAGFPSPAQDYIEQTLDLNELCISHPAATFFVRVEGESMTGAGIFPNDILVVDRSLTARHGDIVIASLEREMTVKQLHLKPEPVRLLACNPGVSAAGDYRRHGFGESSGSSPTWCDR